MSSEMQLPDVVTGTSELRAERTNTLRTRGAADTLIIGVLITLIVVYVNELSLAIPCGGFTFSECRLPSYADALWGTYFKIDPLFFQGADWYVAIMRLQDFVFNPWWIVSLVMFWTGRQEKPWHKSTTIVICGVMLGTTAIAFQVWIAHYAALDIFALALVNGPYAVFAVLLVIRMRHRPPGYLRPAPRRISILSAIALLVAPSIVYVVISMVVTAMVSV